MTQELTVPIEETGIGTLQTLTRELTTDPYKGVAGPPFPPEAAAILMGDIDPDDIEIRPDGLIYYPEIRYRRTLNRAFGPGAWAMVPREITVSESDNMLYYRGALFVAERFISEAIGEQQYFPNNGNMSYATAAESAKSNCLMRCCKDLGIASCCWDPVFIRQWIAQHAVEAWCINIGSHDRGKKKKMWRKRSSPPIDAYPWREEAEAQDGRFPVEQPRALPAPNRAPVAPAYTPIPDSTPPWEDAHRPAAQAGNKYGAVNVGTSAFIISPKQAGRFRAIARANGWTEREATQLCVGYGYHADIEIRKDDYENICADLGRPEILEQVRADLNAEGIDQRPLVDTEDSLPF